MGVPHPRRRLLALWHAIVGHAPLRIDQASRRVYCARCGTCLSPERVV